MNLQAFKIQCIIDQPRVIKSVLLFDLQIKLFSLSHDNFCFKVSRIFDAFLKCPRLE